MERCEYLAELLPDATIIHGDGTDRQLLTTEGIEDAESLVALTDLDEENMMLSMYAKKQGVNTRISKINRFEFDELLDELDIGKVVFPKHLTCDFILQYIRALQNEKGSNVKTLYQILDNRVEVVEFSVAEESEVTDIPLSELQLKPNQLICCITRGDQVIIPRGKNMIKVGDTVIVVSLNHGLNDLNDIVAD
ncbi:MAG: NAD-binding protein, partial [Clostridia bacterium]|nr:NAD-binding protein [Clostridia bacterium]